MISNAYKTFFGLAGRRRRLPGPICFLRQSATCGSTVNHGRAERLDTMKISILDDYDDTLRTLDCFTRLSRHDRLELPHHE